MIAASVVAFVVAAVAWLVQVNRKGSQRLELELELKERVYDVRFS